MSKVGAHFDNSTTGVNYPFVYELTPFRREWVSNHSENPFIRGEYHSWATQRVCGLGRGRNEIWQF